jgi:hypothetical protein
VAGKEDSQRFVLKNYAVHFLGAAPYLSASTTTGRSPAASMQQESGTFLPVGTRTTIDTSVNVFDYTDTALYQKSINAIDALNTRKTSSGG